MNPILRQNNNNVTYQITVLRWCWYHRWVFWGWVRGVQTDIEFTGLALELSREEGGNMQTVVIT